jgi:hypothetical protein
MMTKARGLRDERRIAGVTRVVPACKPNREGPERSSGPFLHCRVHPPYAAEAFLFKPFRVANVFSLVLAAFSSFKFVAKRGTTSS